MNKLLPILILLLASCATPKIKVENTAFNTIYKSNYGGTDNAGLIHITNNEDYIKLIETLKIDESEFNKLVAVNFKENDVVILYQGQKATGGFAIDVAKISWDDETLLITKIESAPNKGEQVTMAVTSPYCITIIPKAKNVKIM